MKTYTVTCGGCDTALVSREPYSSPFVHPLCPTCDALARKAAYVNPSERQAAALERIAAALEDIAHISGALHHKPSPGNPYDAGRKR